ncbi:MAG: lipopolysaccharide biosynthesis protein [Acidimicrobiia bacterium]
MLRARLLAGSTWALGARVLTSVTSLALGILLTRLLRPGDVGIYFLTMSVVTVAAQLATLGLPRATLRMVAQSVGGRDTARARGTVRTVFRLSVIGCLAIAMFLGIGPGAWLASTLFDSQMMAQIMPLAAFWAVLLAFQGLLTETFRAFHDVRLASLLPVITGLLSAAALWAATWGKEATLAQVVLLTLMALLATSLFGLALIPRKLKPLATEIKVRSMEVLRVAWPMLMTGLSLFAVSQIDLWIIGAFRSQEEVAIYGASLRVASQVGVPLVVLNAVVPPVIAEMFAGGERERLSVLLQTSALLATVPALILFVILAWLGEPLLTLLFGPSYSQGSGVLMVLSLSYLVSVASGSCGFALSMTGHERNRMVITLLSGFILVGGGLLTVGRFGLMGVAISSTSAVVVQNVLGVLAARRQAGIWTQVGIRPARALLASLRRAPRTRAR